MKTSESMSPWVLGTWGEEYAIAQLVADGYQLLEQNYHCRYGEIDAIFYHTGFIVFLEVKTRSGIGNYPAIDAITPIKLWRMSRTAAIWLLKFRQKYQQLICNSRIRFDVFCIEVCNTDIHISHLKDVSLWG